MMNRALVPTRISQPEFAGEVYNRDALTKLFPDREPTRQIKFVGRHLSHHRIGGDNGNGDLEHIDR